MYDSHPMIEAEARHQIADRRRDRRAHPGRSTRCRGAGSTQMVPDSPIDLGNHHAQATVRIALALRQPQSERRQWRLQPVRQIGHMPARMRQPRLVLVDQRVQLARERREF